MTTVRRWLGPLVCRANPRLLARVSFVGLALAVLGKVRNVRHHRDPRG